MAADVAVGQDVDAGGGREIGEAAVAADPAGDELVDGLGGGGGHGLVMAAGGLLVSAGGVLVAAVGVMVLVAGVVVASGAVLLSLIAVLISHLCLCGVR